MPRPTRFTEAGLPRCILQAAYRWQRAFNYPDDFRVYLDSLRQAAEQYQCQLHGYALLPNRVQLLVTPATPTGVSQMMQSLGRRYVQYFNRRYARSGTLWDGRYKSCLIEPGEPLLSVHHYVDTLPAQTGVVSDPADYPWSSLRQHVGQVPCWLAEHDSYRALGADEQARAAAYAERLSKPLSREILRDINVNVTQGSVYGSESFRDQIARRSGLKVRPRPRGRPRLKQAG